MTVCDLGLSSTVYSDGSNYQNKADNTWYCASQRFSSKIESDGAYIVQIKYIFNTSEEFTTATNWSSGLTTPMYYQPHAKGTTAIIDNTAVYLDTIEVAPVNAVQYMLTETWRTESVSYSEGKDNLENWSISTSFVRSNYGISDYNGMPAVNTARDPIEVPIMVQLTEINGRYKAATPGALGSGVNASAFTLLGINIPKHCGLITKVASPASDGNGVDISYKCLVNLDIKSLGTDEVIVNSAETTMGGWDVLVPNIGWNCISTATNQKRRATEGDINSARWRESPDKVMLDSTGYVATDGKQYYLLFTPYPEVTLTP